VAQGKGK